MDWLDLLAVQGTLKSLAQHHSSKTSALWYSAFFIVQVSHPFMTSGKTIASTIQTFAGKIMSLFFTMLSRFFIGFLPRSKHLFFKAGVTIYSDFGAQEIKVCQCFHCFSIYLPWGNRTVSVFFDLLEKEMAAHSSTFAWKIPWTEEPGGLKPTGSQRVGHDWTTPHSLSTFYHIKTIPKKNKYKKAKWISEEVLQIT